MYGTDGAAAMFPGLDGIGKMLSQQIRAALWPVR